MTDNKTEINFPCPLSIEERYALVVTGNYSVFEQESKDGTITMYRGHKKFCGITGVYDNYKDALEASFLLKSEDSL